jgi:ribonuclease VapC
VTPPKSVLDASALLAFLFQEPGAEKVTASLVETCAISAINYAEALSKLSDHGQDVGQAAERMARQGLTGTALVVFPVEESQAREIARLRERTRPAGLSLADRACLALANSLKLPVLTADRGWLSLDLGIDVRSIR